MTETQVVYETETNKSILNVAVAQAKIFKIFDEKSYHMAGALASELKRIYHEKEAFWQPIVEKATANLQTIREALNAELSPIENAQEHINVLRNEWKMEQENKKE